jgi:hypothetical protein
LEPNELQTRAGAGWLLKHFAAARTEHYRDAVTRWEQWQSDGFLERLATLMHSEDR